MSRLTAIISAVVICLIVCLGWLANHYHENATEFKGSAIKPLKSSAWLTPPSPT
jgi:prophage endopeptidase